jgi:hypothetical protein
VSKGFFLSIFHPFVYGSFTKEEGGGAKTIAVVYFNGAKKFQELSFFFLRAW